MERTYCLAKQLMKCTEAPCLAVGEEVAANATNDGLKTEKISQIYGRLLAILEAYDARDLARLSVSEQQLTQSLARANAFNACPAD